MQKNAMLKYLIHAATEITISAEGNIFVMSVGASVSTELKAKTI